jgi:hypothetical protein
MAKCARMEAIPKIYKILRFSGLVIPCIFCTFAGRKGDLKHTVLYINIKEEKDES